MAHSPAGGEDAESVALAYQEVLKTGRRLRNQSHLGSNSRLAIYSLVTLGVLFSLFEPHELSGENMPTS